MRRQQPSSRRGFIIAVLALALSAILLGWNPLSRVAHVGVAAPLGAGAEASIECPSGVVVDRLCPPGILPVQNLVQVENSRDNFNLVTLDPREVASDPWYMDIRDVIRTDHQGAMGLLWWPSYAVGQIHPSTVATIEPTGLLLRVGLALLQMDSGGCISSLTPEIETPTGYASACGTYFAVQVFGDGTTVVANIFDGTPSTVWVRSKSPQQRVPLAPDYETTIRPRQAPDTPRPRQGPPWTTPPSPPGPGPVLVPPSPRQPNTAPPAASPPSVPPLGSGGTTGGLMVR